MWRSARAQQATILADDIGFAIKHKKQKQHGEKLTLAAAQLYVEKAAAEMQNVMDQSKVLKVLTPKETATA